MLIFISKTETKLKVERSPIKYTFIYSEAYTYMTYEHKVKNSQLEISESFKYADSVLV